jgi:DNA polymerase III alpha subunit (gram-positive type)
MKLVKRGVKKEEITLAKSYARWYKVIDNEIRILLNESARVSKNSVKNILDYKNDKAYLCVSDLEASKKFYEKHKDLELRLYVKADVGSLYNEYKVDNWYVSENGLEIDLV